VGGQRAFLHLDLERLTHATFSTFASTELDFPTVLVSSNDSTALGGRPVCPRSLQKFVRCTPDQSRSSRFFQAPEQTDSVIVERPKGRAETCN
jgi:hypothetical protein